MKKLLLINILFLLAAVLYAQDLEYAKTVIQKLSSEELKGRGFVEAGDRLAADYISSEYERIGLEPFRKQYYQFFNVSVNTFPAAMLLKINDKVLETGKDYIIDPVSPSISGVFESFTITKQDLLVDQKIREAIQNSMNKFLVIDERNFQTDDKEKREKINQLINYLKYNPEVRTAGTIILTSEKLTWGIASVQLSKPVFTVHADEDFHVDGKVEVQTDAKVISKYKTQNIAGYIKGQVEPDTFLVITAHYDHLGKMGKEVYIPGANDNSSGVAMLLNLAAYYKEHPPEYSIAFVALGAEEMGILGAKHFVENPLFDLTAIRFLVNFDLAGTGDEGIKVVNGSVHKAEFDRLKTLNETNNYLPSVQSRGAACNSDHCMFHEKKVPCFYIYTLGGIQAYHDVYDRFETLPLTEFEDYTRLMIDFFNSF